MNALPVDWKPMATFTPQELAELTRQYVALYYPHWHKSRYSVSVRWCQQRSYIWVFNFKQDNHDKILIEQLGFNLTTWAGGLPDNLRVLLNARPVSIAYDRKSLVVESLSSVNPFQPVHVPTTFL